MGTTQNINKYWTYNNGLRVELDYSQYYDYQLGDDSGILRRLNKVTDPVLWFDSSSGSTISCSATTQEINSLVYWTGATRSGFTINDIGLTGIDTRYVDQMSGVTLTFTTGDTMVMRTVNGNRTFTTPYGDLPIGYHLYTENDFSGQYYQMDGGFFQGFWKLYNYPFELLPTRVKKGWTAEFVLKLDDGCCIDRGCNILTEHVCDFQLENNYKLILEKLRGCQDYEPRLNELYPNNEGLFFTMGTRAENKYWNYFSGETNVTTSSGIPLNPESGATQYNENGYMWWIENLYTTVCGEEPDDNETEPSPNKDPNFDIINNILGFRLRCSDKKIGYRKLAFSGFCENIPGTTGQTRMSATAVVEEEYSDQPIFTGNSNSDWILITVKFERNLTLEGCDLYNRGGINDINYNDYTTYLKLLKYQEEVDWRKGKLVFYVNGRKHFTVDNFEEIISRHLDTHREKQQGVPFNMSWGGGTQGLIDSITFNGWTGIEQDSEDYNLLVQNNFAGTWCGGMSFFKFYIEPLEDFQIINNYCDIKNRFRLLDPKGCIDCINNPYKKNNFNC